MCRMRGEANCSFRVSAGDQLTSVHVQPFGRFAPLADVQECFVTASKQTFCQVGYQAVLFSRLDVHDPADLRKLKPQPFIYIASTAALRAFRDVAEQHRLKKERS